jgi:hypothetical protein
MALDQKTKQIGSYTYTVTQLGAKKGSHVALRLAKAIAPALAGHPLEALKSLSFEDLSFLQDTYAEFSTATGADGKVAILGRPEIFDAHFAGQYMEMYEWMLLCTELNFQSFFDKMRAVFGGTDAPTTK